MPKPTRPLFTPKQRAAVAAGLDAVGQAVQTHYRGILRDMAKLADQAADSRKGILPEEAQRKAYKAVARTLRKAARA